MYENIMVRSYLAMMSQYRTLTRNMQYSVVKIFDYVEVGYGVAWDDVRYASLYRSLGSL